MKFLSLPFLVIFLFGSGLNVLAQSSFITNGVIDCKATPSQCEEPDISSQFTSCTVKDATSPKYENISSEVIFCQEKQGELIGFDGCVLDIYKDNLFFCLPVDTVQRVFINPQLFKSDINSLIKIKTYYPNLDFKLSPSELEQFNSRVILNKLSESKTYSSFPTKEVSTPLDISQYPKIQPITLKANPQDFNLQIIRLVIFGASIVSLLIILMTFILTIIFLILKKKYWKISIIIFGVVLLVLVLSIIGYSLIAVYQSSLYNTSIL